MFVLLCMHLFMSFLDSLLAGGGPIALQSGKGPTLFCWDGGAPLYDLWFLGFVTHRDTHTHTHTLICVYATPTIWWFRF